MTPSVYAFCLCSTGALKRWLCQEDWVQANQSEPPSQNHIRARGQYANRAAIFRMIVTGQLLGYNPPLSREQTHLHQTEHPNGLPATCHLSLVNRQETRSRFNLR